MTELINRHVEEILARRHAQIEAHVKLVLESWNVKPPEYPNVQLVYTKAPIQGINWQMDSPMVFMHDPLTQIKLGDAIIWEGRI